MKNDLMLMIIREKRCSTILTFDIKEILLYSNNDDFFVLRIKDLPVSEVQFHKIISEFKIETPEEFLTELNSAIIFFINNKKGSRYYLSYFSGFYYYLINPNTDENSDFLSFLRNKKLDKLI